MGNGPTMQQLTGQQSAGVSATTQQTTATQQATNLALQHVNRQRSVVERGAYFLPDYEHGGVQAYSHAVHNGMLVSEMMSTLLGRSFDMDSSLAPGDIVPLYYSRGTALAQGADVCEFEIAGSSFKTFRKDHKKLKGKHPVMGWFKRLCNKWFGWFKGAAEVEQRTKETFGTSTEVDHVAREHVRTRDYNGSTKRKITIAGPGMLDVGKYSISNIREYIESCGKQYVTERVLAACGSTLTADQVTAEQLRSLQANPAFNKIVIRLKGHSRGAVAEIEGAKLLKAWIDSNLHDSWKNMIAFDIVQFDPVPGADVVREEHCKVDINATSITHDGKTMGSLAGCCSSTVVYSMYQEHNVLQFTPMDVKGTDRIILTPFKHSVGLDRVDRQKSIRETVAGGDAAATMRQNERDTTARTISPLQGGHSAVYVDTEQGKAYSRDSLNDLPMGVYIMDEYGRIKSIRSPIEVDTIMEKIYRDKKSEGDRRRIIEEVVRAWFAAHP